MHPLSAGGDQVEDIDHPLFSEYLLQQISAAADPRLDQHETVRRYEALPDHDKRAVLGELMERLQAPVSLCRYSPAGPSIEGIEDAEIGSEQLLAALEAVLAARLGPGELALSVVRIECRIKGRP
ncbi:hypothetical protein [Pseudoxanthomonas sp. UTMC 1351]|uniref:hypothetical protein n=1 Tax=Pseudoxanthomonas sp. UTMC 1351 TaxID=2695853 RepID=UPI0034CD157A